MDGTIFFPLHVVEIAAFNLSVGRSIFITNGPFDRRQPFGSCYGTHCMRNEDGKLIFFGDEFSSQSVELR